MFIPTHKGFEPIQKTGSISDILNDADTSDMINKIIYMYKYESDDAKNNSLPGMKNARVTQLETCRKEVFIYGFRPDVYGVRQKFFSLLQETYILRGVHNKFSENENRYIQKMFGWEIR